MPKIEKSSKMLKQMVKLRALDVILYLWLLRLMLTRFSKFFISNRELILHSTGASIYRHLISSTHCLNNYSPCLSLLPSLLLVHTLPLQLPPLFISPIIIPLSHIHICTHNLCSQTCPVLSPWLSQPLSWARALLGKRGQASPNRMLMMSLTSVLQGRGEKWLWKAKITSLFHLLITYLLLDMHTGAPPK